MSLHSRLIGALIAFFGSMAVVDVLDENIRDAFTTACEQHQKYIHPQSYVFMRGLASGMAILAIYHSYLYVYALLYERFRKKE